MSRDKQSMLFDDLHSPQLANPTAPYVAGSETSAEAAQSIVQVSGKLRTLIFKAIKSSPNGMTCDQLEEQLGLSHQTCSARVRELAQSNHIRIDGKRPTRSGRNANVYKRKES